LPTFEFTVKELKKLSRKKGATENIRLCGFYSNDGGKTFEPDEVKCNGCNWEVTRLFVRAENREEAEKLLISGSAGLCGECYSSMLAEGVECAKM